MRLLLVEDDERLAQGLAPELRRAGYTVDGHEAEYLGRESCYDVIVLDLGLPGKSGFNVLTTWRADGIATPIIILTARDTWRERVDGLKAGADDYLGKPFHVEELLARLNAVLRRHSGQTGARIEAPGLSLDEDRQTLSIAALAPIELTGTEFRLLRYFMLNQGKLLSKSRLTEHVYEQDFDRDSNVIEVYVRRLREKIGKDRITTQRGQGYVFR